MAALLTKASLPEFLTSLLAAPPVWGETDCIIVPANWVRVVTGKDPAAALRGLYSDENTARELVDRQGGIMQVVKTAMNDLGFSATFSPAQGDVGLVDVRAVSAWGVCGAIFTGKSWAIRSVRGVTVANLKTIVAWAL